MSNVIDFEAKLHQRELDKIAALKAELEAARNRVKYLHELAANFEEADDDYVLPQD